MPYKIGDKVRIKDHIIYGSRCDHPRCSAFNIGMYQYIGKEATIIDEVSTGRYYLDIDKSNWAWTECMLEPPSPSDIIIIN